MAKDLVLFGTAAFAEVVYWYFKEDSDYNVVAFTAHRDRLTASEIQGIPVIPFDELAKKHPPAECDMFVAVGYRKLNKIRAAIIDEVKQAGYSLVSYVHSGVKLWPNNKIGENVFIFEDNTIQPYVEIGDDVILWSGNHIGHHSKLGNHIFLASHIVVSGLVTIKDYCFIGVNATFRDDITIATENLIGAGAVILKSTQPKEVYSVKRTYPFEKKSDEIDF